MLWDQRALCHCQQASSDSRKTCILAYGRILMWNTQYEEPQSYKIYNQMLDVGRQTTIVCSFCCVTWNLQPQGWKKFGIQVLVGSRVWPQLADTTMLMLLTTFDVYLNYSCLKLFLTHSIFDDFAGSWMKRWHCAKHHTPPLPPADLFLLTAGSFSSGMQVIRCRCSSRWDKRREFGDIPCSHSFSSFHFFKFLHSFLLFSFHHLVDTESSHELASAWPRICMWT